jgi:hypothetical protein
MENGKEATNADEAANRTIQARLIRQRLLLDSGTLHASASLADTDTSKSTKSSYFFHSKTEFIAGYIAACANIFILYPMNKLIFRQILDGISFKDATAQMRRDGFQNLYRGLLPPLLQKSTSYSIMFGSQHEYYLRLRRLTESSQSELLRGMSASQRHFFLTSISAAMAGLTEATLTPLERIQSILQMQQYHSRFRHTWHAFGEITREHGLFELYRGLSAICLRNSLSNVVFFTSRTRIKELLPPAKSELHNSFYDFVSGGLLGALISTFFYPFNVIKSHMQARLGGQFFGTFESLRMIYNLKDRNVKLFYKGVGSNFMRAVFAWGITNSTYEVVLKTLKK